MNTNYIQKQTEKNIKHELYGYFFLNLEFQRTNLTKCVFSRYESLKKKAKLLYNHKTNTQTKHVTHTHTFIKKIHAM